ncbi:thiamine phosphate synthase [Planotetraspora phitsanulokensis]|uniref:Thiamine-phosphate synthase n=1 Tax=Planotetraspora phitsanulokensis TaxID=575192 RepID=A0A8J3UA38_9ACTN|nr:thiamine phosphate synthase [Planotetraspora phitsanulokensis]GII35310.1 thiamine-phosphate synthase [Planotetraspora phitsanulokensis]
MTDTRRERLANARLYLCTDARKDRGDLEDFLDAALAGGVDIVQLRDKGLEAREELELLDVFRAACDRHGVLLAVNDRADIAHAARPDILHLGQDDLPVELARDILGPDILIGRSTHSAEEAAAAAVQPGVDYFCCGPIWPTPTKPGRPAPGPALLKHAADLGVSRPWFGIGGIGLDTIDEVISYGVRRAVVVRAITEADDPRAAAAELRARLTAVPL